PPEIVKDELVDNPPPTQEEMKNANAGTETKEGEKGFELPPANPVVAYEEEKVFTYVEEMPAFPGGPDKLMEYLKQNLKYPSMAQENGIEGRVWISFMVDKTGKIKNIKLLKTIGGGC